eukprot:scaffold45739_cov31-Tisochrysis_lutea.AAC.5
MQRRMRCRLQQAHPWKFHIYTSSIAQCSHPASEAHQKPGPPRRLVAAIGYNGARRRLRLSSACPQTISPRSQPVLGGQRRLARRERPAAGRSSCAACRWCAAVERPSAISAFQLPAREAAAHAGERCFTQPENAPPWYCRLNAALEVGRLPPGRSSAIRSSSSGACVSRSYGSAPSWSSSSTASTDAIRLRARENDL